MTIEQIITELEAERKEYNQIADDEYGTNTERTYASGVARGINKALNFIKYLKHKAEG